MSVVDGLPMPVVRGHVAPGQPAAGSPEHSVDHCAVIGPAPTPLRFLTGQQRLQPGPFLVGQIMTIEHETGLPHPLIKIRGTRSNVMIGGERRRRWRTLLVERPSTSIAVATSCAVHRSPPNLGRER